MHIRNSSTMSSEMSQISSCTLSFHKNKRTNLPGNTAFGSLNKFKVSVGNINLEDYLVMQYD